MDANVIEWLSAVGTRAFAWSLALFVLVNGAALVAFSLKRDRALVNTWTSRVLAVDLLLLGTGVGIPVMAGVARLTVAAVSTSLNGMGLGDQAAAESRLPSFEPRR